MSKDITQFDFDNLSDEEKQYLRDRSWLPQPDDEIDDLEDDEEGEGGKYDDLSHADLKAACESRGLTKSGGKDELIARLVADDEAGD